MPFESLTESISRTGFKFGAPKAPIEFTSPYPVANLDRKSLVFWNHVVPGARLSIAFAKDQRGRSHLVLEASKDTAVVAFKRPREIEQTPSAFRIVIGPDRSVSFFKGTTNDPSSFETIPDRPAENELRMRVTSFFDLLVFSFNRLGPKALPVHHSGTVLSSELGAKNTGSSPRGARGGLFSRIRRAGVKGVSDSDLERERAGPARDHILSVFKALSEKNG